MYYIGVYADTMNGTIHKLKTRRTARASVEQMNFRHTIQTSITRNVLYDRQHGVSTSGA